MSAATMTADEAYAALSGGAQTATMRVEGVLDNSAESGRPLPGHLPENLRVDVLSLAGQAIERLPRGLTAY